MVPRRYNGRGERGGRGWLRDGVKSRVPRYSLLVERLLLYHKKKKKKLTKYTHTRTCIRIYKICGGVVFLHRVDRVLWMVEKRGREGDHGDRDSGEMGRGSDERMNVERTTDRAIWSMVAYFLFLTVMEIVRGFLVSYIVYGKNESKLYLLVSIFRFFFFDSIGRLLLLYRV